MSLFRPPNLFVPGGQTFHSHRRSGGGDKHFYIEEGGTNIFALRGGQTSFVRGSGAYDDVDEEMVVSTANFLVIRGNNFVSEASKLSAGARIFRGP